MNSEVDAGVRNDLGKVLSLLEQRRFTESLAAAVALAPRLPGDRDLLLATAVCQRMLEQIPDALATLAQLERLHPRYSRLYQERGQCYLAMRDAPQAIAACLHAVTMNPALATSWKMLEGLYRMTGEAANLQMAAQHVAALKRLPPEIVAASALFSDGDLAAADRIVRAFLAQHGDHVEALRLLGNIALQRGAPGAAAPLFARVLALAPDYQAARYDYASALTDAQQYRLACAELERLLAANAASVPYRSLYATALAASGEPERAVALFRQLIAEGAAATAPVLYVSLGNALKTLGESAAAIEAYRAATAQRGDFGRAYWSLANMRTYRFSAEETMRMRAAEEASATTPADRLHLCFALGKALEDAQQYEQSWRYYERGNALKLAQLSYQPEPERITRRQIETCTAALFAARKGSGCRAPDPIFIVGLPRSGSTLIEQILASHSQVEGTHELDTLPNLVMELRGGGESAGTPRYPGVLAQLSAEELLRLGERYLAETRVWRTGKAYFVDKLPGNFRHVGLIQLILPNAKIIDARREPLACCVGNFRQLFPGAQEFTYQIESLARYYRSYLELMRHWDRVLPGWVLRVQHEDLVDDLEGNVRRLLQYCGLSFEAQCLQFHETVRSVRTASSEQVRQPLYREGLDQWKHFEPWLGPLRSALGDALVSYRD